MIFMFNSFPIYGFFAVDVGGYEVIKQLSVVSKQMYSTLLNYFRVVTQ